MDHKSEKEEIQVYIQTNEAFEYEKILQEYFITFKLIHFKSRNLFSLSHRALKQIREKWKVNT